MTIEFQDEKSPQMVAFRQQIEEFTSSIELLGAVETPDVLQSQSDRYEDLASAIAEMAARRDLFVSLQMQSLEQVIGFRESLVRLFLVSTQNPPKYSAQMDFYNAKWGSLEIVRPLETKAIIAKYGLKTGVAAPSLKVAAQQLGINSSNSVSMRVSEGLFKLSQPSNLKILQAGIAGETYESITSKL